MSPVCLLSISPSLPAFSRLSFLILQLHTRAHTSVCLRARREKTHISSCSPSCSRPGLFPLIRLLVTPTRAHKRTCRGSKNDVASSTQLPSQLNAFPPFLKLLVLMSVSSLILFLFIFFSYVFYFLLTCQGGKQW